MKEACTKFLPLVLLVVAICITIVTLYPSISLVDYLLESETIDLQETAINETLTLANPPITTSLLCIGPARTGSSTFLKYFASYVDTMRWGGEYSYFSNCDSPFKYITNKNNTIRYSK